MAGLDDLDFGARVRAERKAQGLSQEELAAKVRDQLGGEFASFHRNSVSNVERGVAVEAGTIDAIMRVLGMPPEALTRVYTGWAEIGRELVGAWLVATPEPKQKHALDMLIRFTMSHPHGQGDYWPNGQDSVKMTDSGLDRG